MNVQLLDSISISFNDRIWIKAPISYKLVLDNLDFLQETFDIKSYLEDDFTLQITNEALKEFYVICKNIYDAHSEIDPLTQVAVMILFRQVEEKFEKHQKDLLEMESMLPVRKQVEKL